MDTSHSRFIWLPLLLLCTIYFSGCVTSPPVNEESQPATAPQQANIAEAEPLYAIDGPLLPALDINVVIFDFTPSAEDTTAHSAVRGLEARLLPGLFREALVSSNQWGAVRVVPTASPLAPVNIQTTVVTSDGRDLVLEVQVVDATGVQWFSITLFDRHATPAEDLMALQALFYVVSNRMREYWLSLSQAQRTQLIAISNLLYARELAPDAFSNYVEEGAAALTLKRVPASDDPMLGRVQMIKNQEYLFCDAIDEQLGALLERAGPTYHLWRQAATEQANWLDYYEPMAAARASGQGGGEFARMHASYAAYRSFRIQEQALLELAEALEGESEPVVLTVQDAVVTLEGTLAAQYAAWRKLLREIFLLEQGELQ